MAKKSEEKALINTIDYRVVEKPKRMSKGEPVEKESTMDIRTYLRTAGPMLKEIQEKAFYRHFAGVLHTRSEWEKIVHDTLSRRAE